MSQKILKGAVAQRLLKGAGSNLLGQICLATVQLVMVPVLISTWGAAGYGAWLMLTTIPTYILLSDFGMGNALVVELTRALSREDLVYARRVLQSAWLLMSALSVTILAVAIAALLLLPMGTKVGPFSAESYRWAILIVVIEALAGVQQAALRGVFYSTHRYATQSTVEGLSIFASGVLVALAALSGCGIVLAATATATVRIIIVLSYLIILRRQEPWSALGWSAADGPTLRRMMRPSLAAMMLTLSNALGVQGVLLAVGWALGPAAAGIYAAARMLTRIPLQFSGLLLRASLPELTRSQETSNHALTRRLVRLNIGLTLVGVIPGFVVLTGFGPNILRLISHGDLLGDRQLFAALSLAAGFAALWAALAQPLVALNRQHEFAYWSVLVYGLVFIQPLVLGRGLQFSAECALLGEIVVFLIVLRKTKLK
jgi:O-antigen/teichoic acid export membrane protein